MLHHLEGLERKRDGFLFLLLMNALAFWAFLKYIFLHYVLGFEREKIRHKFYASLWVDAFSQLNKNIRVNATNWRALDALYNYHKRIDKYRGFEKFLNRHWMKTENAQAIRNRYKTVKETLKKEIKKQFRLFPGTVIKILSVASGSAQPLLETLANFNSKEQRLIEVYLLDKDQSALEHSKKLKGKYNLGSRVISLNYSTSDLNDLFEDGKINLVEMVGFLDYRPYNKAINLIKKIKDKMKNGGVFITCNVHPNKEKFFLDWVLLWPMIYRNKKQLKDILTIAGFKLNNIQIINEPHKIHQLAVCYK